MHWQQFYQQKQSFILNLWSQFLFGVSTSAALKNTDLTSSTIMFYFLPCVFVHVCVWVWFELCLFPGARSWDESLCGAVGTPPALLINIANVKVHKNVLFQAEEGEKTRICVWIFKIQQRLLVHFTNVDHQVKPWMCRSEFEQVKNKSLFLCKKKSSGLIQVLKMCIFLVQ